MKVLLQLTILISAFTSQVFAEDSQLTQQQLDEACETARLEKLTPIREKYADQCVACLLYTSPSPRDRG